MRQVCSIMKKITLITVLFISTKFCYSQSLLSKLQNFPLANYLNKPIDSLLANLPAGYDTTFYIGSSSSVYIGATLQVNYMPNFKFWVYIKITDPQFITVHKNNLTTSDEVAWPLHLLRKEKIGSITIFRGAYQVLNEASL
jgi:hypothetical protein